MKCTVCERDTVTQGGFQAPCGRFIEREEDLWISSRCSELRDGQIIGPNGSTEITNEILDELAALLKENMCHNPWETMQGTADPDSMRIVHTYLQAHLAAFRITDNNPSLAQLVVRLVNTAPTSINLLRAILQIEEMERYIDLPTREHSDYESGYWAAINDIKNLFKRARK